MISELFGWRAAPQGDRQYFWITTALLALSTAWALLPSGLIFDPVRREGLTDAGGVFRLQWLPLLGLSLWIIAMRSRLLLGFLGQINIAMFLLLAWCLLSAVWAVSPATAFRQAVSVAGVSLIALAVSLASWRAERLEEVLRPLLTLFLVLSLAVGLVFPAVAIHSSAQFELAGSWRGITYQKNGLGQMAAVALVLWVHAGLSQRVRPVVAWAGAAIALLLLLLSRSSTSLMLSLLACGVLVLILRPPLRIEGMGHLLAGLALGLVGLGSVFFLLAGSLDTTALAEEFGGLFGKDATFSGRTFIWTEVLRNVQLHPWTGTGFNSFWPEGFPGGEEARRRLGWSCPNGHNGYLDLLNELGLIGAALFLWFILRHAADLSRLRRLAPASGALHTALFVYVLLANLTETGWFNPIQFLHLIPVYSSLTVSRQLFDLRLRAASTSP